MLVILAQAACAAEICQRSLDHPAARSYHEGVLARLLAYDLDGDAPLSLRWSTKREGSNRLRTREQWWRHPADRCLLARSRSG
jgi:hypothetical protein